MKKRLKALMDMPGNQVCSDCTERQPRWASLIVPPPGAPAGSLPIGAFCCLECSGSHRRLGVHISFVRSINLDSWKEKEVQAMENGGNVKVNAIFEANLNVEKPTNHADLNTRERFIRDKYERRKFYDPSAFGRLPREQPAAPSPAPVPAPALAPAPAQNDLELQLSSHSREPSAAARRRLEARKMERSDTNSSSQARATPRLNSGNKPKAGANEPDLINFNEEPPKAGRRKSIDLMGFHSDDESKTTNRAKSTERVRSPRRMSQPAGGKNDFFDFPSKSGDSEFGSFGDFAPKSSSSVASAPGPGSNKKVPANTDPDKKTKSAQDIMSLYHANTSQNHGLGANGMNNPMMPSMNNQNIAQMTAMMQQMMQSQQQQQIQQQAFMYQQHMMRLQMQAQQQNLVAGNPMIPGLNMHLQSQRGQPSSSLSSDAASVKSSASRNVDVDPFASLAGRQNFR